VTSPSDESTGRLIAQATEDISTLIRAEMQLAKDDLAQAGKRVGVGAGLFGAAGVIALFAVAGVAALVGKRNVTKVTQAPAARVESVQADVAAAKGDHP
jgi:membrane protein